MEVLKILFSLASVVSSCILAVSAFDSVEMDQEVYEETLANGLYPGNVFRTKLYLHPGIEWFGINLQDSTGNPITGNFEVALSIHVDIDPVDIASSTMERNWYNATGASQLDPPERAIYGRFPFYPNYVFEVTLLSMLNHYELQVNGYDKFTFPHQATTGTLPNFDVVRIMASPGSVDVCFTKFNLDLLPNANVSSEGSVECNQPVQRSLCNDLVCNLFSEDHNMYTSTANPVTMATGAMMLSESVRLSLEEMTEQFCCLEGLVKDLDTRPQQESLQLAAEISTELLTWSGNASWSTVNQISSNGPLSLMDRLDDIAQVISTKIELGERIEAETPVFTCALESNTLETFIKDGWSFKPFEDYNDGIAIEGDDLIKLGFNNTDIKFSIFGAAYTNLTELINYNQKGAEFIVADVISATFFGPDGQISVPTSFTRRLTNILESNSSRPRYPVCAFWDVYIEGVIAGGWSTRGCRRITKDGNPYAEAVVGDYITCHCNHTTNYAILMRIVPLEDSEPDASNNILDALTLIGCIVSIISLLIALAFFIFFKHNSLDTERILIHRNLMGGLLVAMVIFLISTFLTNIKIPCQILAALQHYLFLAVFCWMLVEGVHLYRLIVTVYGSERQMAKVYYSIGWGIPVLIVAISAGIKWTDYGVPGKACWLNPANGFIWAFVGPACVIMLVNMVVLGLVIKTTVVASKLCSQDNLMKVKTGLRSSLVLLPMLGITWTIGLAAHIHRALEYIFVIMNSFQGLWLVIVCCLMNGEVRNAFQQAIKKKLGKFSRTVDVSTSGTGAAQSSRSSKKPRKAPAKEISTVMTGVD